MSPWASAIPPKSLRVSWLNLILAYLSTFRIHLLHQAPREASYNARRFHHLESLLLHSQVVGMHQLSQFDSALDVIRDHIAGRLVGSRASATIRIRAIATTTYGARPTVWIQAGRACV